MACMLSASTKLTPDSSVCRVEHSCQHSNYFAQAQVRMEVHNELGGRRDVQGEWLCPCRCILKWCAA